MMNIKDFISSPWGIVCVGVLSSLIGAGLFKIGEKLYLKAYKKMKHRRFIKRLAFLGEMYCSGFTAGYANKSSFHQLLHVNKFIINILMEMLKIVIISFAAVGLLIVFQEHFILRPIIVAIAGIVIAIRYQKVKAIIKTYELMFDTVFGDEFKKNMINGMEEHWDKLTGKTKNEQEKQKEIISEQKEAVLNDEVKEK